MHVFLPFEIHCTEPNYLPGNCTWHSAAVMICKCVQGRTANRNTILVSRDVDQHCEIGIEFFLNLHCGNVIL